MRRLLRFLKLADVLRIQNDEEGLKRLYAQYAGFIKKNAHYEPINDGITPNPWRRNMDYSDWENSPYFGSVSEFMKKFPGGIKDWVEWRRKTQKERNKMWSNIDYKKKASLRIKMASQKRKAIYSAVFLTPESQEALLNWWPYDLLSKKFAHHMTIKFKPSPEDILSLPLGKEVELKIIGLAVDEKGQAVAVDSDLPVDNAIPHITISTDGTSPVYSNELLASEMVYVDPETQPPVLSGIVGFFDGKNVRYDLTDTIYEDINQEPISSEKQEPESQADEIDYFGEEEYFTDEEREKAFDLIIKNIEFYKEMFGLTDEEIKQWLESKYGKMSLAHFVDVKKDNTKDFAKEPHLWSGNGPAIFKSIVQFLKKYRSQDAKDLKSDKAGKKAVEDFIKYWKSLRKDRS